MKNSKKTLLLLIGDLLALILLIVILVRTQKLASDIKDVRSQSAGFTPLNVERVKNEIATQKDSEKRLKALFPNELQIVDFISQVNQIKSDGILKNFSFPTDNVVRDKTSFTGLPILFTMSGKIQDIDNTLKRLNDLPYMIRSVDVKLTLAKDASASAILDYGGFLYVDENFKN